MKTELLSVTGAVSNFSFSVEQKSKSNFILTIRYKQMLLFRKMINEEIYDYWDVIPFFDTTILYPERNLEGLLDINVFLADTVKGVNIFQLTIYGFEDGIERDYQNFYNIGSFPSPLLYFTDSLLTDFIKVIRVSFIDKNSWIATSFKLYPDGEIKKIYQLQGTNFEDTLDKCKRKSAIVNNFFLEKQQYTVGKNELEDVFAEMIFLKSRTIREENLKTLHLYVNHVDKVATVTYGKIEGLRKNSGIIRFDKGTYESMRKRYDALYNFS